MKAARYLLLSGLILLLSCRQEETAPATASPAERPSPAPTIAPSATAAPPALAAGQWAYTFYHDGLEQVVLLNGGPERGKPAGEPLELWGWDGARWSLIAADESGPTWRNWAAAAYDTARDVLVVHGGQQGRSYFDETWEWDGQTWTRFAGTHPRAGAAMAYDAARAQMILFGGSDSAMQIHGSTWEWDGQLWTLVDESGPAPRFPAGMAYDPARGQVLMYSGHDAEPGGGAIEYADLWAWDGSAWHEMAAAGPTPGHRAHAGFVYDPLTETVLLIGGSSDMWSWDGVRWEKIAANAPVRSGPGAAYDTRRDRFILFGGVDRPGAKALDDTWEWDRTQWSCVDNCQ